MPVGTVLVGTVVVRFVGWGTGGLRFDTWSAAFAAVLTTKLIGLGAATLLHSVVIPVQGEAVSFASFVVRVGLVEFVLTLVAFGAASLFVSGMHIEGLVGFLAAVLALTAVNIGIGLLPLVVPIPAHLSGHA